MLSSSPSESTASKGPDEHRLISSPEVSPNITSVRNAVMNAASSNGWMGSTSLPSPSLFLSSSSTPRAETTYHVCSRSSNSVGSGTGNSV
ncbi:unnamed protein product [Phytophthora fragariaefolia]|uniref:Unnamed protein product n=1 Tax=Phytophthora fragariaefolia TaxID=1490495 RepID=A0A9W7D756_9STRA|nr:unnamed protein product [Phytophthora fragariaefolia]